MEEYEVFDEYLKKTQLIRAFCEDRENMLCEAIKLNIPTDCKVTYLKAVGREIDLVCEFAEEMKKQRKSFIH